MAQADQVYDAVIRDILKNGVSDKDQQVRPIWADGTPAHTLGVISAQMHYDNTEVPLLTKKRVAYKSAINEMLVFWKLKSNRLKDMRDLNVNIWNEWEQPDGTIGPAYGYQLNKKSRKVPYTDDVKRLIQSGYLSQNYKLHAKNGDIDYIEMDQVDHLLYQLKVNPASRRHITTFWNVDDLDEMALTPCVWHTQWLVKENRLHLIVGIRSNDMFLGNPFNVFQYYVLQRMIAQVTGYDMGTLTFNINDAHVYERHVDLVKRQLDLPEYDAPTLWLNPAVKNFYDFTPEDIRLENYTHGPSIKGEVAI